MNRLGQRGETMHGWDLDSYADRARAFGWHAIRSTATTSRPSTPPTTEAAGTTGRPTVIVASTKKGKGVEAVEDKEN